MYDFSQVEFEVFLLNVINLFSDTLRAILGIPVFCLFLAVLLFLIAAGLLGWMFCLGRNRRL